MDKSKFTAVELVYPPISSQEAYWLREEGDVEAIVRKSDFYMIGARAESLFSDFEEDEDALTLKFKITAGELVDDVLIRVVDLPEVKRTGFEVLAVETGPKIVRVWDVVDPDNPQPRLLDWFTTEKLIWDVGRGRSGIEGLSRQREFATYDLLYVGIAKKGDTYDRLLAQGHRTHFDILANERQRLVGARTADEVILFLCHTPHVLMQTFDFASLGDGQDILEELEAKRVVADAEKAFVSLLKPSYNRTKYENYPEGKDGLAKSGLVRYGYSVAEELIFLTPTGRFEGGRDRATGFVSNEADAIFVEGSEVEFFDASEFQLGQQL